jgi:hypothetical protein
MTAFEAYMLMVTISGILVTAAVSLWTWWYPASDFAKKRKVRGRASNLLLQAFEALRSPAYIEYSSTTTTLTEEDLAVHDLLFNSRWGCAGGWILRTGNVHVNSVPRFRVQLSSEFKKEYDRVQYTLFRGNQERHRHKECRKLSRDLQSKNEYQKAKKPRL